MNHCNMCKGCKWWGRAFAGVCDAPQSSIIPPTNGHRLTDSNGFAVDARADDDSGLEAYLVTGPDFGCVRFVPKCPTCDGFGMTKDDAGRYAATCGTCGGDGVDRKPA